MSDINKDKCPDSVKDPDSFPDKLTEIIIKLHWLFISCFGYVILFTIITLIYPSLYVSGASINLRALTLPQIILFICWVLYVISCLISALLFVILFWIFIHWLIIITFVPIIIIFPIPIFPFIFILPLQPLMLELIPPFKVLTNTGTLPTMLKIAKRLFSEELITNTFN